MNAIARYCLFALLLFASVAAQAATAYVTDRLRLGLYEQAGDGGERLRLLSSGDALEIQERQGAYARVRTEDGLVGWVKTAFLIEDKPAALQLREALAERDALARDIERLQAEFKRRTDPALPQRLSETEAALAEERTRAETLQAEVDSLRARLEPASVVQKYLPYFYAGVGVAVSLLVAFLLGYRLHARRLRRRFAGLSIE